MYPACILPQNDGSPPPNAGGMCNRHYVRRFALGSEIHDTSQRFVSFQVRYSLRIRSHMLQSYPTVDHHIRLAGADDNSVLHLLRDKKDGCHWILVSGFQHSMATVSMQLCICKGQPHARSKRTRTTERIIGGSPLTSSVVTVVLVLVLFDLPVWCCQYVLVPDP